MEAERGSTQAATTQHAEGGDTMRREEAEAVPHASAVLTLEQVWLTGFRPQPNYRIIAFVRS